LEEVIKAGYIPGNWHPTSVGVGLVKVIKAGNIPGNSQPTRVGVDLE
jgi:hypothetical protein